MKWLKRKKAVVRAASLLILSSCTFPVEDVQLREDTAKGLKNHEESILSLARATQMIINVLKEKGLIKEEVKK